MTVLKIAAAARAVLPHLGELLSDEAEVCREELIQLLEEDANRLNVDAALLQIFYDHAGLRHWLERWLKSPESSRAARGRRRSPDFSAIADEVKEPVQFRACTPSEISLDAWSDLVAYVHVPGAEEAVQKDVQRQLGNRPHAVTSSQAPSSIRRGAEIEVAVHLPHCHVNPPRASVLWLEDWHRLSFRVRVADDTSTPRLPTSQPGKLILSHRSASRGRGSNPHDPLGQGPCRSAALTPNTACPRLSYDLLFLLPQGRQGRRAPGGRLSSLGRRLLARRAEASKRTGLELRDPREYQESRHLPAVLVAQSQGLRKKSRRSGAPLTS